MAHGLYLELAAFTSAYLAHMDVEERSVMPAIAGGCSAERLLGVHLAIIASIPLDVKRVSMRYLLPALNVDERTALIGQTKAFAPPRSSSSCALRPRAS